MKNYLVSFAFIIAIVITGYVILHPNRKLLITPNIPETKEQVSLPKPVVLPSYIKNIPPPPGFTLTDVPGNHFGQWLQQLPLRKDNTLYLYDGSVKKNQSSHYAILDVPYNRNVLQQCADAVMRLRAEYIYATKADAEIRFYHQHNDYFTCPSTCTRPQLEAYLNNVFSWCGSYNLQAQMKPVINIQTIQTGDVFVKGGSPGHAMLVAATAKDNKGEKVFLLLQSFMPAQDIHIVINPYDQQLSPWYAASGAYITTPGWTFATTDLRRW